MEINYLEIGQRIRKARLAAKVTQEQLAEKVGVGTTHISHIETGNSIPSLKLLVDILNALGLSADAVLCDQLDHAGASFPDLIAEELTDCTEQEIRIFSDILRALKISLRSRGLTKNDRHQN